MSNVWLGSLDNAVMAAREAFDDKRPDSSADGVDESVPKVAGGDERDLECGDMRLSSSSGCEEHRKALSHV